MIKVETVYLWIMGDIVVIIGLCEWKLWTEIAKYSIQNSFTGLSYRKIFKKILKDNTEYFGESLHNLVDELERWLCGQESLVLL